MALLREVEKLDEVPEPYRPFYKPQGDRFVNEDIEDVTGLKNTAKARKDERDAAQRERDTFRTELEAYKKSGLTPAQIADVKAKAEATGAQGEELEKLIAKRIKAREDELEPELAEGRAAKAENRRLTLTDNVRAAFIEAGGLEEDADDVVRLYGDRFELGEPNAKTGKRKIIVKDDDGDPSGQSPKEWFEKDLKKRRPKFFKGTGAAGGGASGGGSGGAGSRAEFDKLPPAERLTKLREQGFK